MGTVPISEKKNLQSPISLKPESVTPRSDEAWASPSTPRHPDPKHVEHHYEIVKMLGDGAAGQVYLAKDRTSGQHRAIKKLIRSTRENDRIIEEEIKVLRRLDHPNVVKTYGHFKSHTDYHIALDFCEGGELFDQIVKSGKLTERQAAQYFADLIRALGYIHKKGVIHRDVKPENLLLASKSADSRIILADFGAAAKFRKHQKFDLVIGTSYYIAPEVLQGRYNHKCDVWSAGVMLYLLLTGCPPFDGPDDSAIYNKIKTSEPSFTQSLWARVSPEAKSLVQQMLTKDPKLRPSAAKVLKSPWLAKWQAGSLPDEQLAAASLNNLTAFNTQSKLIKASLGYLVSQLMSKEEEAELAKLFKSIDKNNDGRLSQEELQAAYSNLGSTVNIDKVLSQIDVDGNGFVEYNEFLVASVDWRKALNKERLFLAFQHFDLNGDGTISLEEMQRALGSHEERFFTKLMKKADRNGDGQLDFEEFTRYIVKHLKREVRLKGYKVHKRR